jgi:hypothetical protein
MACHTWPDTLNTFPQGLHWLRPDKKVQYAGDWRHPEPLTTVHDNADAPYVPMQPLGAISDSTGSQETQPQHPEVGNTKTKSGNEEALTQHQPNFLVV